MGDKEELANNESFPIYYPPSRNELFVDWRSALEYIVTSPNRYSHCIFKLFDHVAVIYDGYPKSQIHLLIVPRDLSITHAGCLLIKNNISIINYIDEAIQWLIKGLKKDYPKFTFQVGIHAVPSLRLLHVHVLSRDLISDHIRTAGHWKSMTTQFFIPWSDVKKKIFQKKNDTSKLTLNKNWQLEILGISEAEYLQMLQGDLVCHRCQLNFKRNLSSIKTHILQQCVSPLPYDMM